MTTAPMLTIGTVLISRHDACRYTITQVRVTQRGDLSSYFAIDAQGFGIVVNPTMLDRFVTAEDAAAASAEIAAQITLPVADRIDYPGHPDYLQAKCPGCAKVVQVRADRASLFTHNRAKGVQCPFSRTPIEIR